MSEIRKQFYRSILYIVLAMLACIIVWESTGPERYIAVASILLIIYRLLVLLVSVREIVDDFFPITKQEWREADTLDYIIYQGSLLFFLLAIVVFIFGISCIDKTVNGSNFFWLYALGGVIVAKVSIVVLKFTKPSVFKDNERRIAVYAGLVLSWFLLAPSIAGLVNYNYLASGVTCKQVVVLDKAESSRKTSVHWLILKIKNKEERFPVATDLYSWVNVQDTVTVCTKTGYLGYEVVSRITLKN